MKNGAKVGWLALVLLAGCGKSEREDFLNHLNGVSPDQARSFNGHYRSGCEKITFNGVSLYQRDSIVFAGFDVGSVGNAATGTSYPTVTMNSFADESALYRDSLCSQLLTTQSAIGTFRFGTENKELTLEASRLTMKPNQEEMTSALNSRRFCGYADWKTDSNKDLLSGTCAADVKTAHYFVNSHDSEARVIDLIVCFDAEMKNCQKVSYLRD
jgi:hypothetical protein